eukprot:GFUD01024179.1.p1 GENE.GFUD01024179.1~~GFUD01024179.1.p1  ORF type:complete len:134 (-),score=8.75 GFUD01024179.1:698-1099(-)
MQKILVCLLMLGPLCPAYGGQCPHGRFLGEHVCNWCTTLAEAEDFALNYAQRRIGVEIADVFAGGNPFNLDNTYLDTDGTPLCRGSPVNAWRCPPTSTGGTPTAFSCRSLQTTGNCQSWSAQSNGHYSYTNCT